MDCSLCNQIKEKKGLLYEDADIVAMLAEKPAAGGHVIVAPKQHHVILEQVSEKVAGELFLVANKLSISLFESLGVQGTNLLVQNGAAAGQIDPHIRVDIVPRAENDGINVLWQPRQLSESEMNSVESKLKDAMMPMEEKKEVKKEAPKVEEKAMKHDDENYLIKSIRRIP